jgi:MoaA/NifB/PqqE/SkfB family radical SAM enzyme
MKLEEIGFYTLTDERAKNTSVSSPLQRCELILGGSCNFKCGYCRGLSQYANRKLTLCEAQDIVSKWASHGLKNIRFSGGEPTLWPHLLDLVNFTKIQGISRIAVSSNGSADPLLYQALVRFGVNDFSISLDACCSATGEIMAGRPGIFDRVIQNIQMLSKLTYVTVGIVVNEKNVKELWDTVQFAKGLGVSDIRIISAAQENSILPVRDMELSGEFPILDYRLKNMKKGRNVRGIIPTDSNRCKLVLDDMAVAGGYHFPCIIYMREMGKPIGTVDGTMEQIRLQREAWYKTHNTHNDPICHQNCLDVCIDYNDRCADYDRKA